MKVYLSQLKCPNGHCVLALASEFDIPAEARTIAQISEFEAGIAAGLRARTLKQFERMVAKGDLNRECSLCHATTFHVDTGRTRWATMEEALPHLRRAELEQALSVAQVLMNRN